MTTSDFNSSPSPMDERPSLQKPSMALLLLFALFAFFLILTPILSGLLGRLCSKPEAAIRIAMVLQDMLVFILPAIVMAMVSTRLPARLLAIDRSPGAMTSIIALLTLMCSIPVMNLIVEWNSSLTLPESMSGFEQLMRELEENAQAVTDSLMAGASVPSLIISILIVGVFAGFGEELFFRGAMQRVMSASRLNMHVVIWTVALVFSLLHFQFYGFVPRMLLGAYFGYLLWWSGSLWVPVIVHTFNNSLVVFNNWYTLNYPESGIDADKIGAGFETTGEISLVIISLILTAAGVFLLRRNCRG